MICDCVEREGDVISLVRNEQEQFFKHMTRKIIGSQCVKEELDLKQIDSDIVLFFITIMMCRKRSILRQLEN